MNKADIVNSIFESGLYESKAAAERSLNTVITTLQNGIKTEGSVALYGFGTFSVTQRKARVGRNPRTGEKLKIKASKTVKFRPSKMLKDTVKTGK